MIAAWKNSSWLQRGCFLAVPILFVLFLLLPPGESEAQVGPPNQILCNGAAILNAAAAGTTQLVTPAAGKTVFICGWHFTTTTTAGTFQLTTGTGATCATGTPVNLTPAHAISSTAPSADHIDFAWGQGTTGHGLCVTTTASATIAGQVWFGQY